ncbi:transglutaminase-like domain-containing protein [Actinopolymorpha sp. B17G11]|uniref:transglutaminase-like domain-containing protein n=1 Tax=Actinopolymorpha sp. B17G11 TaxID=3160861 RepID=UPI0032E48B8D
MVDPDDWSTHSPYSDPGMHAPLLDAVPTVIPSLSTVACNLVVHYRYSGLNLPPSTRNDINSRWLAVMLDRDQERHAKPLAEFREPTERLQGCCRDLSLFCVAVLRQHGIPARSLVGFASYLRPGYNHDHVIVQAYDKQAQRWVRFDPKKVTEPTKALPTPHDIPAGADAPFRTAAEVWKGCRAGNLDPNLFGGRPGSNLGGMWFIHNYVMMQLAHRYAAELLLWDGWGAMCSPPGLPGPDYPPDEATLALIDDIADQLIAVESAPPTADRRPTEALLRKRYNEDDRLNPGTSVTQYSPTLHDPPITVPIVQGGASSAPLLSPDGRIGT